MALLEPFSLILQSFLLHPKILKLFRHRRHLRGVNVISVRSMKRLNKSDLVTGYTRFAHRDLIQFIADLYSHNL